jgi:hypothetical protein
MGHKQIPAEALINLRQRLDLLPSRCQERSILMKETAALYGVSRATLYRLLRQHSRPKAINRSDSGTPRKLSPTEMELYCEIIAAMKIRTSNKKGRHLSTARAIELLTEYGMDTPNGFVQPIKRLLNKTTVNRYLKKWGYDHIAMTRQPTAVSFQAEHSNDCWHFDLSPSDLKHLKQPLWVEPGKGNPVLMLYSVVDDRSGVCYQEYHCVYGEDVEAALRFLFNAMTAKGMDGFPFQGIPKMIYTDNGPIGKSRVFQNVMECLGIKLATHLPAGKDGRRVTARSKGKVERPFRTVKEAHETLYHFIEWLLSKCVQKNTKITDVIEAAAIDLLATRLRTPLQIEQHLTLAFESAYLLGEKPVSLAIVESILSKQIDDLEPTLTRHGYDANSLAEQFNAKPAEIKLWFRGQLDPVRIRELHSQMLAAGLPL